MIDDMILYPLLAQIFLTFALLLLMAFKRVQGARERRYKVRDIALDSKNYPQEIVKFGNSFSNQFELPVLFYLFCVLAMLMGHGSNQWYVVLASVFVAMRYVHATIHVTSNHVIYRFYAFLAGAIVLMIMWTHFAVSLMF